MAVETVPHYRAWTAERFRLAWEAGAFGDDRVELVDGEVWPVTPIGTWYGEATMRVGRLLHRPGVTVTSASLPSGPHSLPDPDVWVRRGSAEPVSGLGQGVMVWRPEDVLLVVEISDTTLAGDLRVKRQVYGAAGFPHYWVVTQQGVYVHAVPGPEGYASAALEVDGSLRLPYGGEVSVRDLVG